MTWNEWVEETQEFLENHWKISSTFSRKAAELYGYFLLYQLKPVITSGFRSAEEQADLMRRYQQGDPGVVYPPARFSKHLTGEAIDISTNNWQTAFRIAAAIGVKTVTNDRVHFQIKG